MEQVSGAEEESVPPGESFRGLSAQQPAAGQVAEDGGELQQHQMGGGIIFYPQEPAGAAQEPEHIEISRRIVREDIRVVEAAGPHRADSLGPDRKAGCVGVEAFGQGSRRQPQGQGGQEQGGKAACPRGRAISFGGNQTCPHEEDSRQCGKMDEYHSFVFLLFPFH